MVGGMAPVELTRRTAATRPTHVKMILPALVEATKPRYRPIKYSLFPPLGLASLAGHLPPDTRIELCDEHVEPLVLEDQGPDCPDLVVIQCYITSARRSYEIADHYRQRGVRVAMGGLHPTSLPQEAAQHCDHLFLGPGDHSFPEFLADLAAGRPKPIYQSGPRTLDNLPPARRDLIKRSHYLVPNSLVVTRGCPHSCDFCYKDSFFQGGRGFYTQQVDDALAQIESLPGKHLYFLDDHILGQRQFARELFGAMAGMGRLWQGAATVNSILQGDLIERAAEAGLRSIFVGFETISETNLSAHGKTQNLGRDYAEVIARLRDLGVMVNGSFVFGMDDDDTDVFKRTVDWAVSVGIETATFHVMTPYPGTALYDRMDLSGRILHRDWDRYDTRQCVFRPARMTPDQLEEGYWWAYNEFYRWSSIWQAASAKPTPARRLRHVAYSAGWKKLEPLWSMLVRARRIPMMLPALESVLSGLGTIKPTATATAEAATATTATVGKILADQTTSTVEVGEAAPAISMTSGPAPIVRRSGDRSDSPTVPPARVGIG